MRLLNVGAPKRLARAAAKAGMVRAGIVRAALRPEPHDGLAILYWHRVGPGIDVFAVTPRSFRRACDEIERSGLRVIDLAELDAAPPGREDGVVTKRAYTVRLPKTSCT